MAIREGVQAARVVQKRQSPHVIVRFDRDGGSYVDGIYMEDKNDRAQVLFYSQPVTKKIVQESIGERTMQDRNGWATIDQLIRNKDKVEIGTGVFDINNIQEWPFHRSFDLTRTGERQNIAEGSE